MAAASAGDRNAIGVLLAAHYDRCFAVCRRILSNEDDALDATQDAMIAIARGLQGFEGSSLFSTWCFRVATNAALDELRRRRRRPLIAPEGLRGDGDPLMADVAPGPDRVAGPVTDRITVESALGRLPEDQRVAVVLRDLADLDYAEIGEILTIPIGTVRSRIARGRAALAALLADRSGAAPSAGLSGAATPPGPGDGETLRNVGARPNVKTDDSSHTTDQAHP